MFLRADLVSLCTFDSVCWSFVVTVLLFCSGVRAQRLLPRLKRLVCGFCTLPLVAVTGACSSVWILSLCGWRVFGKVILGRVGNNGRNEGESRMA